MSKRARLDESELEEAGEGKSDSREGNGLGSEGFALRVFKNDIQRITIRNRQVISVLQRRSSNPVAGVNDIHLLPTNCYDFYTYNDNAQLLYKARNLYESRGVNITDKSGGGGPSINVGFLPWEPAFVNPVMANIRLSKPVSFSSFPGAMQPERVSGNDAPYFFIGIDNRGGTRAVDLGGASVRDMKANKYFALEGVTDDPLKLPLVHGMSKDETFECSYRWKPPHPYQYQPPNAVVNGSYDSLGTSTPDIGWTYHGNLSYLPQQLGAAVNSATGTITGPLQTQFAVRNTVAGQPLGIDPTQDNGIVNSPMLQGNSIPPIYLWVPELENATSLDVNFKVILETELVADIVYAPENWGFSPKNIIAIPEGGNAGEWGLDGRNRFLPAQNSVRISNPALSGLPPTVNEERTIMFYNFSDLNGQPTF